jgi:hypothetical protein
MRVVSVSQAAEIDTDTVFNFSQDGRSVSAHYSGGNVRLGFLIGTLEGSRLVFSFIQSRVDGTVRKGESECEIEWMEDGRVRLFEHFRWATCDGEGTNIMEEHEGEKCTQ